MDLGCFFFATEATNLSWFQAQQYCVRKQNGAFLAEIPSAKTQEFIDTILQELGLENKHWWLGGTDFFQVCNFKYVECTLLMNKNGILF